MKPTQHHTTNTITVDGVCYALPKGYTSTDGVTVLRVDGHRMVPRGLKEHEGRLYIDEYMSLAPRCDGSVRLQRGHIPTSPRLVARQPRRSKLPLSARLGVVAAGGGEGAA